MFHAADAASCDLLVKEHFHLCRYHGSAGGEGAFCVVEIGENLSKYMAAFMK